MLIILDIAGSAMRGTLQVSRNDLVAVIESPVAGAPEPGALALLAPRSRALGIRTAPGPLIPRSGSP